MNRVFQQSQNIRNRRVGPALDHQDIQNQNRYPVFNAVELLLRGRSLS
jgi:hypothetical protein